MNRDFKTVVKAVAVLAALIGAVAALLMVIAKYKEEISDFFAELKMKCPCARREEDDYADEELNCICDLGDFAE